MKIAFIGTGVMGKSMAINLAQNNYEVNAYNRTLSKLEGLEQFGIKTFNCIEQCVSDVDVVVMIVGYPKDVEEVFNEVIKHVKANTCIIDMTTSSPTLAKELYNIAKEKNIHVLDAPVSGGDTGAKNATLSIMVGGEKHIFDKYLEIFNTLGKQIVYQGEAGSGQHTKLANQIAIAGCVAGVSEAIKYAKSAGLDPVVVLESIASGAAGSWQMSNNGPKMIEKDFEPGFYIKHFIKDMDLAIEEANNLELNLSVLNLVNSMYKNLTLNVEDTKGTQAIIDYYK